VKETLGSGDGTQQFQSFILHQSPLTYVQSAAVSGSTTTLQVWVDGVLWSEVPYFYGHGPTEHIYITSQDDNGVTTVTFGDGITGSRLTTGTANVTAQYRFGIGSAGLVNANQLSQLMNRPLGVRGVNNPLASSGAADPEDLNTGRGNATLAIMTLGRVVSLEDYQDFALAYTGIGKALATWTWDGQQRVVVLTIAGQSGPIASTDPVMTALPLAIAQVSEPNVQLFLYAYTPLYFNMTANVQISPDYQVPIVQPLIETALQTTFGFAARSFGQPVYASEVIAVIQGIAGVVDVTVVIFPSGSPSLAAAQLAATVPQTGGQDQIAPAQLLTIDPGTLGITVTTVTT
jgi:predicted phage baseplate assembly protein